jgi:hypothetical protein
MHNYSMNTTALPCLSYIYVKNTPWLDSTGIFYSSDRWPLRHTAASRVCHFLKITQPGLKVVIITDVNFDPL